tara:strand:- start:155 stop:325 length:171 start_codon:yes stop_codon:yes gene_type:complete
MKKIKRRLDNLKFDLQMALINDILKRLKKIQNRMKKINEEVNIIGLTIDKICSDEL